MPAIGMITPVPFSRTISVLGTLYAFEEILDKTGRTGYFRKVSGENRAIHYNASGRFEWIESFKYDVETFCLLSMENIC